MRKLLALALGYVVLVTSAAAQNPRNLSLRTLCFDHVEGLNELLVMTGGAENPSLVEVELFRTAISEPVAVRLEGSNLVFAVADGEENGRAKFRTVAQVRALASDRQLAVFVPNPGAELPYRVFMIDDTVGNFPMGSTLAINLSGIPFQFTIGEHVQAVAPGQMETIPMARRTNDRGQVPVTVSVADAETREWRAVNQSRWFSGADKRDLLIAFIHPQTGRPTVSSYQDNPPWLIPE